MDLGIGGSGRRSRPPQVDWARLCAGAGRRGRAGDDLRLGRRTRGCGRRPAGCGHPVGRRRPHGPRPGRAVRRRRGNRHGRGGHPRGQRPRPAVRDGAGDPRRRLPGGARPQPARRGADVPRRRPGMRAGSWGRIVAITSLGVRQPYPNLVLSNTARTGATGFLRTLAQEVAADGVTVNSVLPGLHATDRMQSLYGEGDGLDEALATVPAGRLGEPEELAAVVAFLCSAQAASSPGRPCRWTAGPTRRCCSCRTGPTPAPTGPPRPQRFQRTALSVKPIDRKCRSLEMVPGRGPAVGRAREPEVSSRAR